jgi:hypothetical protein
MGKKARGSWDSDDKRTKAGKAKSTYHPHKDFDTAVSLIGGLFNSTKKKNKPINSSTEEKKQVSSTLNYEETKTETEEEKVERQRKDRKALPYIIILGLIGFVLVIMFWVWIISLF